VKPEGFFFSFPEKKSFVISVRLLIKEKNKAKVKLLGFRILSSGKYNNNKTSWLENIIT
jgi:hypothetical protein